MVLFWNGSVLERLPLRMVWFWRGMAFCTLGAYGEARDERSRLVPERVKR